jgi:very-short-patch-repair endonuclease
MVKEERIKELRECIALKRKELIALNDELAELLYNGQTKTEFISQKRQEQKAKTIAEKMLLMEEYKKERKETKSELIFKTKLLHNNIIFDEQKSFVTDKEMYACDFFLPEYNIVVELDGGYHDTAEQQAKDRQKNKFYKRNGYALLRLKNEVADKISSDELKEYLAQHWERCKCIFEPVKKPNKIQKQKRRIINHRRGNNNKKY